MSSKQFLFGNEAGDHEAVIVKENLDPDYSMYTWPCAPVLAQYVWLNRHALKDKHALEIGAGTSLPGALAARCGARVTLSDSLARSFSLSNCQATVELNQLDPHRVSVIELTWGLVTQELLDLPQVDLILASDCFFDSKDFNDILATVHFFMLRNPNCRFWTTYQVRRQLEPGFPAFIASLGMRCRQIPLDFMDESKVPTRPTNSACTQVGMDQYSITISGHMVELYEITLSSQY